MPVGKSPVCRLSLQRTWGCHPMCAERVLEVAGSPTSARPLPHGLRMKPGWPRTVRVCAGAWANRSRSAMVRCRGAHDRLDDARAAPSHRSAAAGKDAQLAPFVGKAPAAASKRKIHFAVVSSTRLCRPARRLRQASRRGRPRTPPRCLVCLEAVLRVTARSRTTRATGLDNRRTMLGGCGYLTAWPAVGIAPIC